MTKGTLLQILSSRSILRNDITVLPESNKSIEQGGLSFYVMKDDTRVAGPWHDPSYTPPRSPDWIPAQCQHIVDSPRPWMRSLLDKLRQPPSHRAIIWICTLEGKGGVGKSLLNLYLDATGIASYLGVGTPTQLLEATVIEGERKAYTLDLPKSSDSNIRISDYVNAIEMVKNGFIKTAMHGKPKRLRMDNRPHVVVFSNILPPYKHMTEGRFECYTIDPTVPWDFQVLKYYVPLSE